MNLKSQNGQIVYGKIIKTHNIYWIPHLEDPNPSEKFDLYANVLGFGFDIKQN